MYRIDYDSDDEFEDETWSSSFEKVKKCDIVQSPDPICIERTIMNACVTGDLSIIQQYYTVENSIYKPNYVLVGNYTALMQAASYSQNHILKYLLDIGADPNFTSDGITALMCACSSSSIQTFATLECIKNLIDRKALINVRDKYGVTPLMRAVTHNKIEVVQYLLTKNVNIEMRNGVGRTAIFYAVERNLVKITEILIKGNASLDSIDRRGFTVSLIAKGNGSDDILKILNQVLPDNEDEAQLSYGTDGLNWCDMLPHTRVAKNRPAYFYEIAGLLRGMDCQRLEPLFCEANVDLETFLTLDDKGLKDIGVDLPYERLKILEGLKLFHVCGWNLQCVLGLMSNNEKKFNPLTTLDIMSSHMKNITILKCSVDFCLNRLDVNNTLSMEVGGELFKLVKEVNKVLLALKCMKQHITKINKNNLPPASLILPNNPSSRKSFQKTKIIFYSVSFIILTTVFNMKHIKTFNISSWLSKLNLK